MGNANCNIDCTGKGVTYDKESVLPASWKFNDRDSDVFSQSDSTNGNHNNSFHQDKDLRDAI